MAAAQAQGNGPNTIKHLLEESAQAREDRGVLGQRMTSMEVKLCEVSEQTATACKLVGKIASHFETDQETRKARQEAADEQVAKDKQARKERQAEVDKQLAAEAVKHKRRHQIVLAGLALLTAAVPVVAVILSA